MKRTKAAIAAAAIFLILISGAGGVALAGHPLGTEDAGTQGIGNVDVEFNVERQHGNDGTRTTSPGNVITLGIAPKLDLAVAYAYDFTKESDGTKSRGMGPVDVTLKRVVTGDENRFPTLGIKTGISFPDEEGEQLALPALAIGEWSFEPVTVFANVGADVGTRLAGNTAKTTSIRASVAGSLEVGKEWYLRTELLWEKQTSPPLPFRSGRMQRTDRGKERGHRNAERQRRRPVGAKRRIAARHLPARLHARVPRRTFRPGGGR